MLYKGAYVSDKLMSLKPTGPVKAAEPVTFDAIKRINKDVIAWVTVDNTNIDHPVLQGKSNLEYVNKDVYGKFAFGGSIFLDSRNDKKFNDVYSLLYGHHMEHGAMFGDLELFLKKDFFDSHTTGSLITEDNAYKIEFFSVVKVDGYDTYVFNPTHVTDGERKDEFLRYIDKKKVFSRDVKIGKDDRIIALSTCTTAQTNGRTVLFGVLKPNQ